VIEPAKESDGTRVVLPRPDRTVHPVGRDHTGMAARQQLRLLEHCGLQPTSHMLEIGCGIGRLVYELAQVIDGGSYHGFDISPAAIDWLREHYGPSLPAFRFDLVDVTNPRYRPRAGAAPESVRFPYDDDRFDFACAFSVFTHLRLPVIENYLGELARVLAPGGRGVMTFFLIRPGDDRPRLTRGRAFAPMGDGAWTTDADLPEKAIAFEESLVRRAVADAGLVVVDEVVGRWRRPPRQPGKPSFHKDVLVLSPAG
jgi:SAM-dependent methyltransferase